MEPEDIVQIEEASLRSMYLEADLGYLSRSRATGFLVRYRGIRHLVTNRHVISGKGPDNRVRSATGSTPSRLILRAHLFAPASAPIEVPFPVLDEYGSPLWLEHRSGKRPEGGNDIDVAVIRAPDALDHRMLSVFEYDLDGATPNLNRLHVTQELFVVGHPGTVSPVDTVEMAVWTRATIASEPDLRYGNLPRFLIDARTREGQSGSPVITYSHFVVPIEDREFANINRGDTQLVGVYSGRTGTQSDLGFVWPTFLIGEIVDGGYYPDISDMNPPLDGSSNDEVDEYGTDLPIVGVWPASDVSGSTPLSLERPAETTD